MRWNFNPGGMNFIGTGAFSGVGGWSGRKAADSERGRRGNGKVDYGAGIW
jgi:hypothetical protein